MFAWPLRGKESKYNKTQYAVRLTEDDHNKYVVKNEQGYKTVRFSYLYKHMNPDLQALGIIGFFDATAYFFRTTFFMLFMMCDFGMSDTAASMSYSYYGLACLIYSVPTLIMFNDVNPVTLMLYGSMLEALGTIILVTAVNVKWVYFTLYCIMPVGAALGAPVMGKIMKRLTFFPAIDKVNTMSYTIQNLGSTIALWSADGLRYAFRDTVDGISEYRMMFIISGVIETLMSLSILLGVVRKDVVCDQCGRAWKIISVYRHRETAEYYVSWFDRIVPRKLRRSCAYEVFRDAELHGVLIDISDIDVYETEYDATKAEHDRAESSSAKSDFMDKKRKQYMSYASDIRLINAMETVDRNKSEKMVEKAEKMHQGGRERSQNDFMTKDTKKSLFEALGKTKKKYSKRQIVVNTIKNRTFLLVVAIFVIMAIGTKTAFRNLDTVYPPVMQRHFEPLHESSEQNGCIASGNAASAERFNFNQDADAQEEEETVPWAAILSINPIIIILCSNYVNSIFIERLSYMNRFIIGGLITAISTIGMSIKMTYSTVVMHVVLLSIGEMFWSASTGAFVQRLAPAEYINIWMAIAMIPVMMAKFVSGMQSGFLLSSYCPDSMNCYAENLWSVATLIYLISPVLLMIGCWMNIFTFGAHVDREEPSENEESEILRQTDEKEMEIVLQETAQGQGGATHTDDDEVVALENVYTFAEQTDSGKIITWSSGKEFDIVNSRRIDHSPFQNADAPVYDDEVGRETMVAKDSKAKPNIEIDPYAESPVVEL